MEDAVSTVVFANSCAGGGKAAGRIAEVRAQFAQRNFAVKLAECGSPEEFRKSIRAALASGSERLVAMGGDGTLQLLVRETIGFDVSVGVIPAGGGNDVARALGIKTWKEAIDVVIEGRTRAIDMVSVGFANGEEAKYLGGGGVGLDAEAARRASGRFKSWPGRLRYLAAAIDALRGYEGMEVNLEISGVAQPIPGRVLLAAVLNTPSYGGGVRLAPRAQVDDGELDFVVVEKLSVLEIARLIPGLFFTGELRTPRVQRFRGARARLSAHGSPWFHGDGELLGKVPVEIAVLPRALRVLAPERASVAQEGKRIRVGGVDDDTGDNHAEKHDHQHVGNVSEQLSPGEIVTRNRGQDVERGVRMLNLAARTATQPSARVHGPSQL
jgi:diacylglycerol kinase (ATP)